MTNIVKINDTEVRVVEYQGQRVATLAQIDAVHARPDGTAGRNFREHKCRLIEGEDYLKVGADEFRRHLDPSHSKYASEDVILMTEQGYLMLVKSFTDDLAWQVQRQLVNSYFRGGQQPPQAMTPAEMFLQNAQAMVLVERRQLAQAQELARISESVDSLMVGTMTLTERPANSEPITHIRPRMLAKYQLPGRIVDLVMRQMPYSPKPAGMVRNHREEAHGASYAVYWVKDVNITFSRFVRECKRVTATKVTHPDIDERFTLAPGVEE